MRSERWQEFKVTVASLIVLSLAVLFTYLPTLNHDFITFDDYSVLKHNPDLYKWKTWASALPWAFQTFAIGDWQPFTWITHIAIYRVAGLNPTYHFLGNFVLHLFNCFLLFFVMKRLTAKQGVAVLIALFFAIHPQHVESVAWFTERKDVLGAFFWLLTTLMYLRFVRTSENKKARLWYSFMILSFLLGIMSKPTLVTLPFVFLLLDFWPLNRVGNWKECLREKIPLFLLVLFSCLMTLFAVLLPKDTAVESLEVLPWSLRMANALVTLVVYLYKTFYPYPLYFLYPYPDYYPLWKILGAMLILCGITVLVLRMKKEKPYLLVGWLWFLGTLIPVLGFIQIGSQSMADRYMYIPHIGLFMAVVLFLEDLPRTLWFQIVQKGVWLLVLLCGWLGWRQVQVWETSESLYKHSLSHNPNNFYVEEMLCAYYYEKKQLDLAKQSCERAQKLDSEKGIVYWSLGRIALYSKNIEEALLHFKRYFEILIPQRRITFPERQWNHEKILKKLEERFEALEKNPQSGDAYYRLGNFWVENRLYLLATDAYREALRINANDSRAATNLGNVFFLRGKFEPAEKYFKMAIALNPENYAAYFNYALFLVHEKRYEEVEVMKENMVRINPNEHKMKAQLRIAIHRSKS